MKKNKTKGLSMVEVLIIMMIMGILISISLPKFMHRQFELQLKGCQASEQLLAILALMFRAQSNSRTYPQSLNELISLKFTNKLPTCPSNDSNYSYTTTEKLNNFTIYCNGIHYMQLKNIKKNEPFYDLETFIKHAKKENI